MKFNKSGIEIAFHNEERVFSLGDRIRGVIEFPAQDFPRADHLVLEAFWETHGFGGGDEGKPYYSNLLRLEKAGEDGTSKTPFEFTVPNTYPTMRGKLVKIDHYLLVSLPRKVFFKRYRFFRTHDFVVKSEGFKLCETNRKTDRRCSNGLGGSWHSDFSHSKQVPVLRSISFLIFCAAFLASMIYTLQAKNAWDQDVRMPFLIFGSAVSCFLLPCLIIAIVRLVKYLELKTEDYQLALQLHANQTIVHGKKNALSLSLLSRRRLEFTHFDVLLGCNEYSIRGMHTTNFEFANNEILDSMLVSLQSLVLEKNEQYDLSIPLNIEDLKVTPSFYEKNNTIEWTIVIKAKARNLLFINRTFPIKVSAIPVSEQGK
ncbi:MAG: hypothetical protein HOB20_04505 [Planctomycetaceae bacterium]|jgi:hypothetical protein|nr:hypothetical protein [Planctomycetaceae bacterium]